MSSNPYNKYNSNFIFNINYKSVAISFNIKYNSFFCNNRRIPKLLFKLIWGFPKSTLCLIKPRFKWLFCVWMYIPVFYQSISGYYSHKSTTKYNKLFPKWEISLLLTEFIDSTYDEKILFTLPKPS